MATTILRGVIDRTGGEAVLVWDWDFKIIIYNKNTHYETLERVETNSLGKAKRIFVSFIACTRDKDFEFPKIDDFLCTADMFPGCLE